MASKPERPRASIFATCKQCGFVLQGATKPAKKQIAQDPPQDGRQTRATSCLIFAKQAAAVDVAGGGSRRQQADSGSKQARHVARQGAQQGAKIARNAKCVSFFAMAFCSARQAAGEQSQASRVCQS